MPLGRHVLTAFNRREFLKHTAAFAAGLALAGSSPGAAGQPPQKFNVIVILADDIGYGDLSCYGATRVQTPNLDRMAAQGLRFTDAHAPSATCTPSRYALLTGEYAWRKKGTDILPGDANLIIEPGRTTLPSLLKDAGYVTAAVGKWHLGLGRGPIDWNAEVSPGPRQIGFDYSFIIPATGDRVPCVYMENQRVVGLDPRDPIQVNYNSKVGDDPTGRENPDQLKMKLTHGHDMTIVNGVSRIGWMSGGKAARWTDEDMADTITRKAVGFIEANKDNRFFLYFATHDIHVPRLPHSRFAGTTPLGPRGDAIAQLDASVGQILSTLERLNLTEQTLVIFSSDNGPVLDDGYADGAVEKLGDHKPAGPLRGGKYSLYEGGTRLPFIARWPGRIKPGVSDALVCQIDLLASLAPLVGQTLPQPAAPDSIDVHTALLGDQKTGRDHLVEHANGLALRKGPWKLIPQPTASRAAASPAAQLFNVSDDPGETTNLAAQHPEIVKDMTALLEKIRREGRSRF